jgi:hypothetical protein
MQLTNVPFMEGSSTTKTGRHDIAEICVLKVVVLIVFVMFCIDDNPLFGFLDK